MRVALVCPYSLSVFGGVQTQVIGLAAEYHRLGHDVEILAPGDDEVLVPGFRRMGGSVRIRANGSIAPISPGPGAWRRTLAALRASDVAHVHEPFVPGPSLASLLQARVPIVGTFHQAGFGWPYRVAGPLARLLGSRMSASVAVSEAAAGMVRRPLGREIIVLWNGVPAPGPVDPVTTVAPTISFLGRHEARKGLDVLLEAVGRLEMDLRVWVMGEGPLTGRLKERFASDRRIEWLGRVGDRERDCRLASSDVYCAPNLGGESFGLVLLEAMRFGTAVVASDIEAFRSVGRPERSEARLFPVGDAVALSRVLGAVLSDESERRRLAAGGRRRASELSMASLAERYCELFERAVGRSSRAA